MPSPSLLQRLKERKLVQWAIASLAAVWVIVEATNLVVEQSHVLKPLETTVPVPEPRIVLWQHFFTCLEEGMGGEG